MRVADRDRLVDLVAPAVVLARRGADAAEHGGERDRPLEDPGRLAEVALGVLLQEARDVDVARALVLAGRQAVRVVVAEDQLEVRPAQPADLLGLGLDLHPVLARARAARSAGAPRPRPRRRTSGRPRSRAASARSTGSGSRSRCRGRPRGSSGRRGPRRRRPSTSIRIRGVDWGRCGAWVVSRRSAAESSIGCERVLLDRLVRPALGRGSCWRGTIGGGRRPGRLGAGPSVGRRARSAALDQVGHAVAPSGSGGRRRPGTRRAGGAHRARRGSSAGRSSSAVSRAARGRTGAEPTTSAERSRQELEVAAARRARREALADLGDASQSRSGTGSSCRTPRRRRSGSGAGRGRRRRPDRRRRSPSPSRRGRRPRAGPRTCTACRAASGGRIPPVGPPTTTALSVPARGRLAAAGSTISLERRPERHLGHAAALVAADVDEDRARGIAEADRLERLRRRGRGSRARRRGSARSGRPSARCGSRASPGAAGAAPAGRACRRGPSGGPSPRRACTRPGRCRTSTSMRRPLPSASSPMKLRAPSRRRPPPRGG